MRAQRCVCVHVCFSLHYIKFWTCCLMIFMKLDVYEYSALQAATVIHFNFLTWYYLHSRNAVLVEWSALAPPA